MTETTLGNLLPHAALHAYVDLLKRGHVSVAELKALCHEHKEALLAKGCDDRYVAYVLAYIARQQGVRID